MRGKPKNYSTTVPAPLLSRAQTTNKEERRTKLGDLASLLPLGDEWHPAPQDIDLELSQRAQKKVDKYRRGHAVSCFGCCTSLPAERLPSSSRPLARKWMSMLKFAACVDVRSSGDFGLCLGWRARKPSPCALRSSHTPARVGRATDIKPHLLDPGLYLSLHWILFLLSRLFALSACACCYELAVTPYAPTSSVSLRGIFMQINVS